jgi:PAS domain S-box-containing protein
MDWGVRAYFFLLLMLWTGSVLGLLAWEISGSRSRSRRIAVEVAQAHFNKDWAFRLWSTAHGGVYVPADKKTPPNPFLAHIPERDIVTPSGKKLTLMNPAYMMRQVQEQYAELFGVQGHITGLTHFRPETAPDEWERAALESFEKGNRIVREFTAIKGEPYLRLMQPMQTEEGCLKCHAEQGYKVGDVRGGVGLYLPMKSFLEGERQEIRGHLVSFLSIYCLGVIGITAGTRRLARREKERDAALKALESAYEEVERRVHQRTGELFAVNERLKTEVAERERLWEELTAARERMDFILSVSPAVIYACRADPDFRPTYVAGNALGLLGLRAEEIIANSSLWMDSIHPEDASAFRVAAEQIIKTGSGAMEYRFRRGDGGYRWIHDEAVLVRTQDGLPKELVGACTDITDRRNAEAALRDSEENFRQLAENIEEAFWLTAPGRPKRVAYVSPAYERMWGRDKEELIGGASIWLRSVLKDDLDRVVNVYQDFLKGLSEFNVEYRIVRFDGAIRWIWDRAFRINDDAGALYRVAGVAQDVTRRKADEERQRQLVEEIKHFAYIISHDLRAPLVNLRGFSGELRAAGDTLRPVIEQALDSMTAEMRAKVSSALKEDFIESLDFIDSAVSHMNRLISGILKLSRLGHSDLELEPVNMDELVGEIIATLAYEIQEKGIQLNVQPLPEVIADRLAMEQIMANLIGNAVKYKDPSRPLMITITGHAFPDEVCFIVQDSGRGISQADQTRVFQVFQRSGDSDTPGEGMGLAYVRTLVRRHGGRIWCESELGEGSTFTFTIHKGSGYSRAF